MVGCMTSEREDKGTDTMMGLFDQEKEDGKMSAKERLCCGRMVLISFFILCAAVIVRGEAAHAADKDAKPVVTRYWMSIATERSSIPGMPEGMPDMGGILIVSKR